MADSIVKLAAGSVNNGTELIITDLSSDYIKYEIAFSGLYSNNASATNLVIRTSTDNGATFASGSSSYTFELARSSGTDGNTNQWPSMTLTYGQLVNAITNSTNDYMHGVIEIFNAMNANAWTTVLTHSGGMVNADGQIDNINVADAAIQRQAAEANNAVKIFAMTDGLSASNFSMRYALYGYLG